MDGSKGKTSPSQVPRTKVENVAAGSSEEAATETPDEEFWDAPWTIEDEWLPHDLRGHRRDPNSVPAPTVWGLM